ncbi:MAG TPA: hypothetical protein VFB92_24305 [Vicinamibacterales bacterium]|nr:hypothetical protein [Vicinamibacterales bacterium]
MTIVRPDTLVRWHRDLFRLFCRLKSLHNHAGGVLACDFFIVVTATFQRLYAS